MIIKYFLPCFAFTLLFYQTNAMQESKSKLPKEEKLKKIAEDFMYECNVNCRTSCHNEKYHCDFMCELLAKTFKKYNDILNNQN